MVDTLTEEFIIHVGDDNSDNDEDRLSDIEYADDFDHDTCYYDVWMVIYDKMMRLTKYFLFHVCSSMIKTT